MKGSMDRVQRGGPWTGSTGMVRGPGVHVLYTSEILLRLHAQYQPRRKTQISVRKFSEVRKHNRYACSLSFFSPGWESDSDYVDFSARSVGLKILARFENIGLGFSARAELRPGLNPPPCNR